MAVAQPCSSSLERALDLKRVAGCDIFIGSEDAVGRTSWGLVFGGQVLAQALVAAQRTVSQGYQVHALHGFFVFGGTSGTELLFQVKRVRDGRSFATRTVLASQANQVIFQLSVSFHRPEWGPSFQTPGREFHAVARSRGLDGPLPTPEELLAKGVPIERTSTADNNGDTESLCIGEGSWWNLHWMRHKTLLPDIDCGMHEAVFAWITDARMVSTVLQPNQAQGMDITLVTSLNHSIHFHGPPFRVDEWLLFSNRTTVSAGARGLARSEVFTQAGRLVATVTQEALHRVDRKVAERETKLPNRQQSNEQGSTGGAARL